MGDGNVFVDIDLGIRTIRFETKSNLRLGRKIERFLLLVIAVQQLVALHLEGQILVQYHVIRIVAVNDDLAIDEVDCFVVDCLRAQTCLDPVGQAHHLKLVPLKFAHLLIYFSEKGLVSLICCWSLHPRAIGYSGIVLALWKLLEVLGRFDKALVVLHGTQAVLLVRLICLVNVRHFVTNALVFVVILVNDLLMSQTISQLFPTIRLPLKVGFQIPYLNYLPQVRHSDLVIVNIFFQKKHEIKLQSLAKVLHILPVFIDDLEHLVILVHELLVLEMAAELISKLLRFAFQFLVVD